MEGKMLNKLENEIKSICHLENSGHDLHHAKRVYNLSKTIQEKEGGDKLVIKVSSYLHDSHRIIQNETGEYCSPKDSLSQVKLILDKVGVPESKKVNILHCIEFHEEYGFSERGKTVTDIETLILQDADNLDAIGAIGIARAFMYGGANKIPIWIPELPFDRKYFDESQGDISEIHHFYSKLLRLKDNMNTKTGKQIAEPKHKFMEQFLEQFFKEWKGEF